MIDGLLNLPSHLRGRLASALESGLLAAPYSQASLRSVLGSSENVESAMNVLLEFEKFRIPPYTAALFIRAAERVEGRAPRPDLVWTGPEVPGLHARDTRRVYEELLGSAKRSVWVSTYAFFEGPRVFQTLGRYLDDKPDLHVTLLINILRKKGDSSASDQLVRKFANRFWATEWPGSIRPRVYYDPRSLDLGGPGGVLHAKAVVVDDELVFVTSANLTDAALDRNIELGILVRDKALAASVSCHFQALIDKELLFPLPFS